MRIYAVWHTPLCGLSAAFGRLISFTFKITHVSPWVPHAFAPDPELIQYQHAHSPFAYHTNNNAAAVTGNLKVTFYDSLMVDSFPLIV